MAFCAEYDALPTAVLSDRSKPPGLADVWLGSEGQEVHAPDRHAWGHNLIAGAAVAVASGLRGVVDEVGLKVSVFGTLGEEFPDLPELPPGIRGGGKVLFLEAGVFEGVHAALMLHPTETPYGTFIASKACLRQRARFSTGGASTGFLGAAEMRLLREVLRRSLTSLHQVPDHYFAQSERQKAGAQADIEWYGPSLAEGMRARDAVRRYFENAASSEGLAIARNR